MIQKGASILIMESVFRKNTKISFLMRIRLNWAEFEKEKTVKKGTIGSVKSRLFSMKVAIGFVESWLNNRKVNEES
jgi:aminoglycoside N3'-acetyltransferase